MPAAVAVLRPRLGNTQFIACECGLIALSIPNLWFVLALEQLSAQPRQPPHRKVCMDHACVGGVM